MTKVAPREAWQALYSHHGMQYGGSGNLGMLSGLLHRGVLVLDAGCGEGKTTSALAHECTVVGCDFSKEALISLRSQRDPEHSVNLVECELGHIPFGGEKFDIVSCVHVLSHMMADERVAVSEELSVVLKPKGHLFAEVFGIGDMRFGKGKEVERASFLRGNGIMTHYFEFGELGLLFPQLDLISEVRNTERAAYGATAGRREVIRALFRKT